MAEAAAWHADAGAAAMGVRRVHRESRPARELGRRLANVGADVRWALPRDDRSVAAGAVDPDAVSRPGVRQLASVRVLRGPSPAARRCRTEGARRIRLPVREPRLA